MEVLANSPKHLPNERRGRCFRGQDINAMQQHIDMTLRHLSCGSRSLFSAAAFGYFSLQVGGPLVHFDLQLIASLSHRLFTPLTRPDQINCDCGHENELGQPRKIVNVRCEARPRQTKQEVNGRGARYGYENGRADASIPATDEDSRKEKRRRVKVRPKWITDRHRGPSQ